MGPLRHDMAQIGVSAIPQFPPPQQAMSTMSQSGPSSLPPQQIPTSGAPTGMHGLAQQPTAAGQPPMHQHMPNQPGTQQPQATQSQPMPNMPLQQPPSSAAPHMMNMNHIQHSQLPPNFSNPTSPPPVVSSAPTSLPPQQQHQQQPPQASIHRPQMPPQQHALPVSAPSGGSFPPYGPAPHSQPNGPVLHAQPPTATAPPPMNMNHHSQMSPYQATGLPPYMQMAPGSIPPGGFPPISSAHHHHMLGHMMPPPGSPLTINTAANSPQNIPIYQQQR